VNWAHFRAFFWLRWRLRVNHLRRSGLTNKVLLTVLAILAVLVALGLFVMIFFVGLLPLAEVSPLILMYVWDGAAVVFLFSWTAGLVAELQRSEALSLDKFLHLPVSLGSAFVINFLSSLLNLSLLVFVPSALGLSLGLAVARGPVMLLLVPLVAAFLLMVTAVTYQLQGWLASLMVNQRRRRTIVALITITFVLLAQLPNLFNMLSHHGPDEQIMRLADRRGELDKLLQQHKITYQEYLQQWEAAQQEQQAQIAEANQRESEWWAGNTRLANLLLPPGWLPLGAFAAAEGRLLPPLLAMLGMAAIGTLSLWRSYRTTLRIYTGDFTAGRKRPAAAAPRLPAPATSYLLEKRLPGLSEPTSAVALATFRSFTRAPEVRMMLLSSMIMLIIMGAAFGRTAPSIDIAPPLLAFGIMAVILMGMLQLTGNQFGLDRGGFQTFVLCGVRRQDILFGKNLALAPVVLGIGLAAAALLQFAAPMGLDYLLALLPQFVSMYLLFCLLANWMSILAPVRIPAGALRGAKPSGLAVLLQLGFVMVIFPVTMAPLLLPMGAKLIAQQLGFGGSFPLCSLLAVAELGAVAGIYRCAIARQGRLLQAREKMILATVRSQPE
jgi:hypothetical protein